MGQNCAIAIGINEYYNQRSLKYAERDAEALRDYCVSELGFSLVYYFSDTAPPLEADHGPPLRAEPTYGNIQNFLDRRFSAPFLQPGDNLWFFFAGHGKRSQGRDYLMLRDSNPGNVERTGIAIRDLTEQLRRSGADNIILMLDACRTEDGRDDGGIGLDKQKGVITFFSCSPQQISYEIDDIQHGAFTHTLLEALRIQGEGNCATIERLYQHLRYQVPALNRRYGKPERQTPYVIAEPATKLHLILLPQQATLSDVQALKNDAFEAEAEGHLELAEQLWIRVLAASPADIQAIKSIKRLARLPLSPTPSPPPLPSPSGQRSIPPLRPATPQSSSPASPSSSAPPSSKPPASTPRRQPSRPSPSPTSVQPVGKRDVSPRAKPTAPSSPPNKPSNPKPSIQPAKDRTPSAVSSPRIPSFSIPLSRRRMIQIMGFTGGSAGVWWLGRTLVRSPAWSLDASSLSPEAISEDGSTIGFNTATVDVARKSIEVNRGTAAFRRETLGEGIVLDLVKIPAGSFLMGSPENELNPSDAEGPQHEVTLKTFWMSRFPITQEQWKAIATLPQVDKELASTPSFFKGDNRPVEQVSWTDAVEACKRLTNISESGVQYRLPSEAEWEYACRAGTTTPFHFGETITPALANYNGNYSYGQGPKGEYRSETTPVGHFNVANAFGLSDMHGNVWEWCQDEWHGSYEGAPTDGSAWQETPPQSNNRVRRGGSWYFNPRNCRSAFRAHDAPDYQLSSIGFRVVLVPR